MGTQVGGLDLLAQAQAPARREVPMGGRILPRDRLQAASKGRASRVSGACLGVYCIVQALFAANEHWFLNEKGCVGAVDSLAVKPEGFS